jgi:hypothetical protein
VTCPHCAQSIRGLSTDYRPHCMNCQARAVARCDAMRAYMTSKSDAARVELQKVIRSALPHLDEASAFKEAKRWWSVDRAWEREGVV